MSAQWLRNERRIKSISMSPMNQAEKIARPKPISFRTSVSTLVAAMILAGCATAVDTTRPVVELPSQWSENAVATPNALQRDWWLNFNSNELVGLIDEALAANTDLKIATERVRQAEITARLAGASLAPVVTVQAGSSASWDKPAPGIPAAGSQNSGVTVGVAYEVDLWGRVAAVARGSRASLDASRFDSQTVQLTVTTGVASGYFQVLALRMRLAVARENLAISERVQAIVDARFRFGAAAALDVSRQRTTVLQARAALLPLQVQERQTITALSILLGRPPESLRIAALSLDAMTIPEVAVGMPSELLTRRPDLASAEASLAGADANVAAARAALLPTVSLSGSVGASGPGLLSLTNPAYGVELAASFVRSLFDADSRRSQVEANESARRQLVETYRRAVYTSLKEVEDALSNAERNRQQELAQLEIRAEAQRSLDLSQLRYREGANDLSSVLDAQRTLFSANDSLAQLRLLRLTSSLDLFKALGGGWERPTNTVLGSVATPVTVVRP